MANPEQASSTGPENQELTDNDLEQVNGGVYILMGERPVAASAEDKPDSGTLGFVPTIS